MIGILATMGERSGQLSATDREAQISAVHAFRMAFRALLFVISLMSAGSAWAQQGLVDIDNSLRIESVTITIANPSEDPGVNAKVEDTLRRRLAIYPNEIYSPAAVDFALAIARRNLPVDSAVQSVTPGATGGVALEIVVTLGDEAQLGRPRGFLATGQPADFPVLYDYNGTFVTAKLETLGIYYGNGNAWYGQPDAMLAGNPLVQGTPAGAGYADWVEGFVHGGIYGITPVTDSFYVYGGLSAIASGSTGEELFTDETRGYVGVEDAYAGFVTGETDEAGNRLVINASAGRKRFTLGDGFLIINTSANGYNRAALQSNPRWAADMLAIAQVRYNNTLLEVFRVDPDELPVIDTDTVIDGINFETTLPGNVDIGLSYLHVPQSTYGYFTTTETFTREGLQVYDARFRWEPGNPGQPGPYFAGEYAAQINENFDMDARGYYGEAGWQFPTAPWTPTISYRYANFSGDDPDTATFERWDPLLSGGNGEQWVQGINHFKVVQDSNVIAQRLQLRLRPTPKIELVPQYWNFRAESLTNLGGNPALSFLGSDDLGQEINLTLKYFPNRKVYVQGHVAWTFPGEAVDEALGYEAQNWFSTMLFTRIAF
jgi:hypothetical protein